MAKPTFFKSPLRYPGGKQKLATHIFEVFPETCFEYREPMVGGGGVFLYAKQSGFAKQYWINDLAPDLMSFWTVAQHSSDCLRLIQKLREIRANFSEDHMKQYFKSMRANPPSKEFDRAVMFFFNNRVTFSGTADAGGYSNSAAADRFTESSINRLNPLPSLLTNTRITCEDFERSIFADGKDVFLFLDPPHFDKSRIYGKNGALNEFDHEKLARLLQETKHRFLMTLDDSAEIHKLYSWASIKKWNVRYGMTNCGHDSSSKLGPELLISNYSLCEKS